MFARPPCESSPHLARYRARALPAPSVLHSSIYRTPRTMNRPVSEPESDAPGGVAPVLAWAAGLFVLAWLAALLAYGARKALVFDGWLWDGTFQLLNPMRRLDAGQRLGRDFQLFHGPGFPYIHYPLYAALGRSLQAAEFARYAVTSLCHLLAILAFCSAWTRRLRPTVVLTALVLIAATPIMALYLPSASSFGVRAIGPTLVAGALLLPLPRTVRAALAALALALSLILGVDQGMAAVAGLLVAYAALAWRAPRGTRLWWLAEGAGAASGGVLFFVLGVLLLTGADGYTAAMRYWFKDVPANQFWLFGAPPIALTQWRDVFTFGELWLFTALLAILAVRVWRLHGRPLDPRSSLAGRTLAATMLIAYAMLSFTAVLGMPDPKYFTIAQRAIVLLLACMGWDAWTARHARAPRRSHVVAWTFGMKAAGALVSVLAVTLAAVGLASHPTLRASLSPVALARLAAAPRLGPAHERDVAQSLAFLAALPPEDQRAPRIWSDFAGLFEFEVGVLPPTFDYMFHALGRTNESGYMQAFAAHRPELVRILHADGFPFRDWLHRHRWSFYERVLQDYEVGAVTELALLWRRRTTPLDSIAPRTLDLPEGATRLALPTAPAQQLRAAHPEAVVLYVVELQYEVRNRLSALPILGQLPRYGVDVDGVGDLLTTSLPPRDGWASVPIPLRPGEAPTVRWGVYSLLPGAEVRVRAARLRAFAVTGADTLLLPR